LKILVVQLRRLGDVLLTTPLLRALKTHLPRATVHVLVEPAHARILRGNPYVDEVIDPRGGPILAWRLRTARYDAVLDCLGTPGTARLAWLSGARRRIGFRRPGRTVFYSQAIDAPGERLYSALEKLLLAGPLGVQETDCRLDLVAAPQDRREAQATLAGVGVSAGDILVAFSPVSRRRDKAWPPDRFAALCDRWHTREGWRFLAMCGPGEEGQVRSVLRSARSPAAHLVPRTAPSLGGLRAIMESCRLYLGNDNAIRHIAIAASRPTAAVFGRPNPASWTPPGSGTHVAVGGGQPIHSVSLAALDAALEKLMAELPERPRRTEDSRRS
jgi:ADP-heptose:LPS heptosyltransferase